MYVNKCKLYLWRTKKIDILNFHFFLNNACSRISMHVCVCVCVCVCMCAHVHACVQWCVHECACMCVRLPSHIHTSEEFFNILLDQQVLSILLCLELDSL